MYPYLLMLGLPALFGLSRDRRLQAGWGAGIAFILFVGVIGLRYQVGPDWFAYTNHLQLLPLMSDAEIFERGEIGWSLLVRLSVAAGLGIHGLAFASGLVFCIGLFALARACQEPMLAIVAAVPYLAIAVAMSGMRQAMAIGIIFFLISRWYRYTPWRKILLVLLATSFHFSAIAMMILIVLESSLPLIQRLFFGVFIAGVSFWQIGTNDYRVERYSTDYFGDGGAASAEGAIYHVALTAIPCIVYFLVRKRWENLYGKSTLIDAFALIGCAALALVLLFPTATDRMTLYFSAVALIVQSNLPRIWRGRLEQFLVRSTIIALNAAAMLTFLFVGNKAGSFVPYMSVFSTNYEFGLPRR